MAVKKYYWLKLMESFFEEDTIAWLEEQENGVYYTNFYLKLCLKSLKTNGILIRNVGEILIPYDIKKLAEITHVKFDTAIVAMELFKKIGLVEILENGEIYLTQLELMVGKETSKAELMRNKRKRENLDSNKGKSKISNEIMCKNSRDIGKEYITSEERNDEVNYEYDEIVNGNNVTKVLPQCYTEKEIDKDTDIETETDREKNKETESDKQSKIEKQTERNIESEREKKSDKDCEKKTKKVKKSESKRISTEVCCGVSISKSKLPLGRKNIGKNQNDSDDYDSSKNLCECGEILPELLVKKEKSNKQNSLVHNSEDILGKEYCRKIKVFRHFEKCGFTVTTQLMEYISEDINTYGEEWVIEGANECVTRNKVDNYSYLTGILQRWKSRGRIERSLNKESKANASAYEPMKSILD